MPICIHIHIRLDMHTCKNTCINWVWHLQRKQTPQQVQVWLREWNNLSTDQTSQLFLFHQRTTSWESVFVRTKGLPCIIYLFFLNCSSSYFTVLACRCRQRSCSNGFLGWTFRCPSTWGNQRIQVCPRWRQLPIPCTCRPTCPILLARLPRSTSSQSRATVACNAWTLLAICQRRLWWMGGSHGYG